MGINVSTTDGMADIDLGDSITDEQVNAIIDSGDPVAIEALMRGEVVDLVPYDEVPAQKQTEYGEESSAASGAEAQGQSEITDADSAIVDETRTTTTTRSND